MWRWQHPSNASAASASAILSNSMFEWIKVDFFFFLITYKHKAFFSNTPDFSGDSRIKAFPRFFSLPVSLSVLTISQYSLNWWILMADYQFPLCRNAHSAAAHKSIGEGSINLPHLHCNSKDWDPSPSAIPACYFPNNHWEIKECSHVTSGTERPSICTKET